MRKMPSKVFPDIPFGADDSCRSRVACPTLNITKRDCGRSIQLAKSGFPTSQGKCISHTHTHSESLKKFAQQKSTRTRRCAQELSPENKLKGEVREGGRARGREMDEGKSEIGGVRRKGGTGLASCIQDLLA